jgi:hypothetical protein
MLYLGIINLNLTFAYYKKILLERVSILLKTQLKDIFLWKMYNLMMHYWLKIM